MIRIRFFLLVLLLFFFFSVVLVVLVHSSTSGSTLAEDSTSSEDANNDDHIVDDDLHVPNNNSYYGYYDVCIYKATPGGIAAALSASFTLTTTSSNYSRKRDGNQQRKKAVLLLEPSMQHHIGGMMTEGGIGMRDIPIQYIPTNPNNTFVQWGLLNGKHYNLTSATPIWQPDNYVGEQSLWKLLHKYQHANTAKVRLDVELGMDIQEGKDGVIMTTPTREDQPATIVGLRLENNTRINCRVVIDASYEGDILLASGGSYTVGRESNTTYDESLGGITNQSDSQFLIQIDPFVQPPNDNNMSLSPSEDASKRERILLPFIQSTTPSTNPTRPSNHGKTDSNIMAYSYRVCWTQNPRNKVPVPKPKNYNPKDFELIRRYIQAQLKANATELSLPWDNLEYRSYDQIIQATSGNNTTNNNQHLLMKYDACCGSSAVGIDLPGMAQEYPLGSRLKRQQIVELHRYYVQGLMWFWQNDPVVPYATRQQFRRFGLCRDEWQDNQHFPRQIYARETIRMIGDQVYTQNDRSRHECRNDSIAFGSWEIDIHDVQRIAVQLPKPASTSTSTSSSSSSSSSKGRGAEEEVSWTVMNEGNNYFQTPSSFYLFDLPYWILTPKRHELTNLLVINTPSVSHVAFAAIRTEPTLWHLGMAAGTAAAMTASTSLPPIVQQVDISQLQKLLQQQGVQIHGGPKRKCRPPHHHHHENDDPLKKAIG